MKAGSNSITTHHIPWKKSKCFKNIFKMFCWKCLSKLPINSNKRFRKRFVLPGVLFIFIFLATFGNGLVILVYTLRMRGCLKERYFIPILAVFDLLAATYCGGFMIYQGFYQITFQNKATWQTLQFLAGFVTYIPVIL